ncbi:MAG: succinate--CoA ligase subunit alpha [candidate division Zixibacteria bacterium]|nr:succinate--CoA ligase subunit alpha [candidate division Zixibacteria bacterium]MDD5427475.1 succinate--CoA ligase subunit alpha [candidate division Zixibacteria bacterium]
MSIFINKKTKVVVQGITGRDGSFHAEQMKKYGTDVVAGVTPGKGNTQVAGIPVFNTMEEAVAKTKANTSVIYVPPAFATDAIYEAADAGIELIVCVTEGVPANDMLKAVPYVKSRGARLVGPNCPGLISPEQSKVGILPSTIVKKGNVGVISRSGTLTYEAIWALTLAGLGQSTCIGIGGDQVIGTNFIDCLKAFQEDPATRAIVMIGEIGGSDEEIAAEFIRKHVTKPVVSFIAGRTAPPGKRMGHAGAIISGGSGTAEDKIKALEKVGIPVAASPLELPVLLKKLMKTGKKKPAVKKEVKKSTVKKTTGKTSKKVSSRARAPQKKTVTVRKKK